MRWMLCGWTARQDQGVDGGVAMMVRARGRAVIDSGRFATGETLLCPISTPVDIRTKSDGTNVLILPWGDIE